MPCTSNMPNLIPTTFIAAANLGTFVELPWRITSLFQQHGLEQCYGLTAYQPRVRGESHTVYAAAGADGRSVSRKSCRANNGSAGASPYE